MTEECKEWGIIDEQYSEADWIMWGIIDWSDIAKPTNKFSTKRIQYNQDEYQKNTCTIYASIWAYSSLRAREINLETRKNIVDNAIELWLDVSIGRYVNYAVKCVADYFEDVSYARVKVGSEDFRKALELWFDMVGGYSGNSIYNKDRDDDIIVQWNDRGKKTYSHCIRHTIEDISIAKKWDTYIVDNYKTRKSNVYTFAELEEKIKNGNIFTRCYFYFDKFTPIMANLPKHISKEEATTPEARDIVVARENEISVRLEKSYWNKDKLYANYLWDEAISKMLIDLKLVRLGIM